MTYNYQTQGTSSSTQLISAEYIMIIVMTLATLSVIIAVIMFFIWRTEMKKRTKKSAARSNISYDTVKSLSKANLRSTSEDIKVRESIMTTQNPESVMTTQNPESVMTTQNQESLMEVIVDPPTQECLTITESRQDAKEVQRFSYQKVAVTPEP